jgi:hypothetical protein
MMAVNGWFSSCATDTASSIASDNVPQPMVLSVIKQTLEFLRTSLGGN